METTENRQLPDMVRLRAAFKNARGATLRRMFGLSPEMSRLLEKQRAITAGASVIRGPYQCRDEERS